MGRARVVGSRPFVLYAFQWHDLVMGLDFFSLVVPHEILVWPCWVEMCLWSIIRLIHRPSLVPEYGDDMGPCESKAICWLGRYTSYLTPASLGVGWWCGQEISRLGKRGWTYVCVDSAGMRASEGLTAHAEHFKWVNATWKWINPRDRGGAVADRTTFSLKRKSCVATNHMKKI